MNVGGLFHQMAGGLLADGGTFWLPPQASNFAEAVDPVFYFIYWTSVVSFAITIGFAIYFSMKYCKARGATRSSPIKEERRLEVAWSVIPAIFLIIMFAWGQKAFTKLATPPSDALQVRVTGQKWKWSVAYPNHGKKCSIGDDTMVLPVDTPVKFTITSSDVIHSFFIPAFRVKRDAVPNHYSGYWVEPTKTGTFDLFCAEYCGQDHSQMKGEVRVVSQSAWKDWLDGSECATLQPGSPDYGKQLFSQQGCNACHSVEGEKKVGPPLNDLYGTKEELADGSTVEVDDDYIRESIMEPNAKIVAGYGQQMPSFQGRLNEQQVNGLITYMKQLSDEGSAGGDGGGGDEGGTKVEGE